jgi:hypothetical protein
MSPAQNRANMKETATRYRDERLLGKLRRTRTVSRFSHTLCAPQKKLTNGASSLHSAGHMLSRAMFIPFESWFEHSFHGFSRFITSRASPDVVSLSQHCT